jgi:ribbon-helix-helix protein
MKNKQKPRRAARKTVLFAFWLPPEEKQKLEQLSTKTGIDQSKLARRGLGMLFEAYNRGQLELGFPENPQYSGASTQNVAV